MNQYDVVYEQLVGGRWQRVSTFVTARSESEARQYVISHNVNQVRIISIRKH